MVLSPSYLTPEQIKAAHFPTDRKIFLSGPAGTGKTAVGVERLLFLLENGIPGNQILILVPQRTLASPFYDMLFSSRSPAGGSVTILTIGGLARRMVDLFWPTIAGDAGFQYPDQPPVFLTLETAQYYMARIVQPRLEEGYFDGVVLEPNRLFSQILDNLNKAAINGFPYTEIGSRLTSAWIGEPGQVHVYEDVQECASEFRRYCLSNNLLDFSLQMELLTKWLWTVPECRTLILGTYRHLVYDNLEEDTPAAADLLYEWMPHFGSTLLIFDQDAGYRRFLGADPPTTFELSKLCDETIEFSHSLVLSKEVSKFGSVFRKVFFPNRSDVQKQEGLKEKASKSEFINKGLPITLPRPSIRFYPDMLDWVVEQIQELVARGVSAGEIVIISPFLSDALRYALVERLTRYGIPTHSHRPSRALSEEPAARCLLSLAKLAHPQWELIPLESDITYALTQGIRDLDLIRAQLLTQNVYQQGKLLSFENVKPQFQERITYLLGNRYEDLRFWIVNYLEGEPQELDHFLGRLFGELLSQPGYGFHYDYNAGTVISNLVESIQKFRWAVQKTLSQAEIPIGKEYLQMVEDGVIASQYLAPWRFEPMDSVFLAPAHTFLMSNRPVDYQVWLDVGGRGWYERLYQPLTHPYVLQRRWPIGRPWTDMDESEREEDVLYRLCIGLVRRCRQGIILGISEINEQGYEQKGDLLRVMDKVLRILRTS
jgi:superfamily I DNA/RNA helicase